MAFHSEMASFARVAVVEQPVLISDPQASAPQAVTIPITVTGSFIRPRQRDAFAFEAKKGDKIRVQVASRILGFAADPILLITDSMGKMLAENDDGGSRRNKKLDPELDFSAPADGQFHIVVRDVHGQASERHLYRLTLDRVTADFALSVSTDSFVVPAGKSLEIPLTIDRKDAFSETIQLSVEGLPQGMTAAPATSEKEGDSAKSVKLTITAAADAAEWQGPITVVGTTGGDRPLKRTATYRLADFERPRSDVWLALTPTK
jgi:hypothetical protein